MSSMSACTLLALRFARSAGLPPCARRRTSLDGRRRFGEISSAVKSTSSSLLSASAFLFLFGCLDVVWSSESDCALSTALACCSSIGAVVVCAWLRSCDACLCWGSWVSSSQGKCCVPSSTPSIAALMNNVCSLFTIGVQILQYPCASNAARFADLALRVSSSSNLPSLSVARLSIGSDLSLSISVKWDGSLRVQVATGPALHPRTRGCGRRSGLAVSPGR
jgi:hypothetical protein